MDFIRGQRLDDAWQSLSDLERGRIMEVIAGYLRQFRALRQPEGIDTAASSVMGAPFRGGRISAQTRSPIQRIDDFHLLLRTNVPLQQSTEVYGEAVYQSHLKVHRTAFAHGDICPRNIILDRAQVPYLIDWEFAGWWPEYWEYTKLNFAMWEEVPGWLALVDQKFPVYALELEAERILQG